MFNYIIILLDEFEYVNESEVEEDNNTGRDYCLPK
jgi:hypothetical protein